MASIRTVSDETASKPRAYEVGRLGIRRRPSGEAPPLPKAPWWPKAVALLGAVLVLGVLTVVALTQSRPTGHLTWFQGLDGAVSIAKILNVLASPAAIMAIRLVTAVVLIRYGRLRHLAVAVLAFWVTDIVATNLHVELPDPETWIVAPAGGTWWFPASAIASLSISLGVAVMSLAPAGRIRQRAMIGAVALAVAVAVARAILGAAYPFAALYSVLLGFSVAAFLYGWLAPDESFPVSYKRGGNAAHLDLEGARAQAVRRAMRDQLGLDVVDLGAFGDEGSGGSTPLLMTLARGDKVFGKILATSHVVADRWYRVVRTIMYGRLEDETSFSSVRQLVEQEDYALRLLDDVGFRVAHSYGIVELTPNREYMLVEEFFDGADTLGHAEVTDEVIAEGIALVRRLWDAGLAHRDIKPANLLVVDGHLQLIDVSGLEVRPSPWRQAVDLANMMLVLALRTDAPRVYAAALERFTPEDVAEAFAAAHGMAIPTELQRYLKEDTRDLIGEFRRLAPERSPISIQRWSARRVLLTLAVVGGGLTALVWSVSVFFTVLD
jgi:membrane-associated phospholipid phosphatase/serine/threonine-protein kinase RIO1